MSLSKLKGLFVAVAAGGSTLVVGVSSAWATTTPPGASLWLGNVSGDTLSVVVAVVAVAATAVVAALYGVLAMRAQAGESRPAGVHDIRAARRPTTDQRKAA